MAHFLSPIQSTQHRSRDRRAGPATALGRLVSVVRVVVCGLVAVPIRCVLLVSHILYSDDGVSDTSRESGTAEQNLCPPCLTRVRCRPRARPMPRSTRPCMPLSGPARPLSMARAGALQESGRPGQELPVAASL